MGVVFNSWDCLLFEIGSSLLSFITHKNNNRHFRGNVEGLLAKGYFHLSSVWILHINKKLIN